MMKTIENSPIYNMSMCSLENFHTCFINWLGNAYPVETLKLFMPDKNADNIKFKKQVKHNSEYIFDLCVTIGNNNEEFLVIENKLKSFPTEEQLINYNNAFEGKNATFVLLSLAPEIKLPNTWKYLSYGELAKRMHKIFDNAEFLNEYHKYLIADYIANVDVQDLNNKIIEYTKAQIEKYESIKTPVDSVLEAIITLSKLNHIEAGTHFKIEDVNCGDEVETHIYFHKEVILSAINKFYSHDKSKRINESAFLNYARNHKRFRRDNKSVRYDDNKDRVVRSMEFDITGLREFADISRNGVVIKATPYNEFKNSLDGTNS